jgi:hypothetical protein
MSPFCKKKTHVLHSIIIILIANLIYLDLFLDRYIQIRDNNYKMEEVVSCVIFFLFQKKKDVADLSKFRYMKTKFSV